LVEEQKQEEALISAIIGSVMQKRWDAFWHAKRDSRFTKISWSKRRMMKILDKHVRKGTLVLDAGCGSGFFSDYFIAKGCQVYSLDYSEEALDITRKVTQGKSTKYLKRDLLKEDLRSEFNNTFDLIFTDGLLEHFSEQEQEQILKTFITMKREQGLIITFVPNRYSFWAVIRPIFVRGIEESPFTLKELISLVGRCGQKIISKGGINVLPFKYSPEILGGHFGMLLYVVSKEG